MNVLGSCVTGYGEDLVKSVPSRFGHGRNDCSLYECPPFQQRCFFHFDIGGQDMKATFIENGVIKRLEINEACSSGCGSFIETFANSLNYSVPDFSKKPEIQASVRFRYTLHCLCNSKVKQAQREGASVADISAGLGYSIVKNCLNKVLKLKDIKELGNHIMVQGGTFRNLSVIRALELELGKEVMVTDYPELMGAYGAAKYASKKFEMGQTTTVKLATISELKEYSERKTVCKGCENNCTVTQFKFDNDNKFYSGNKCEKIFNNSGEATVKGANQHTEKYDLLFNRAVLEDGKITLGVPRTLGMYENYPFWHSLLTECGIRIVLSDKSTMAMYETGIGTVMADNICFPAKLVHGHIYNLVDKRVDRIFIPYVVFENKEDEKTNNSYNCPIVTGYSDVIKSAINPQEKFEFLLTRPHLHLPIKS